MEIMEIILFGLAFIGLCFLLGFAIMVLVSYGLTNEPKWAKECEDEIK